MSIAVVVLAVSTHFFAPHLPQALLHFFTQDQHWRLSSPGITFRNPVIFGDDSAAGLESAPQVEFSGTFNTRPERSMVLVEHAKRVAAEFEFGPDAVNKAVKEFIREMGKSWPVIGSNGR